jgi:hypothetical protein
VSSRQHREALSIRIGRCALLGHPDVSLSPRRQAPSEISGVYALPEPECSHCCTHPSFFRGQAGQLRGEHAAEIADAMAVPSLAPRMACAAMGRQTGQLGAGPFAPIMLAALGWRPKSRHRCDGVTR